MRSLMAFWMGGAASGASEAPSDDAAPPAAGRATKQRRRYIMPDGRIFIATTEEVLSLLQQYSVLEETPQPQARPAPKKITVTTPRVTLQKRDVRFVPAQDAELGTYKAVISERFTYRAPPEAYRHAEIIANRMRADEEAILALDL